MKQLLKSTCPAVLAVSGLLLSGCQFDNPLSSSVSSSRNRASNPALSATSGSTADTKTATSTQSSQSLSIESTVPSHSSTVAAATLSSVAITFSAIVNAGSISSTSVQLIGPSGPIAATALANGRTVSVTPTSPLADGTSYTISVANTVSGVAGESLASPYNFSFATATATAAAVGPCLPLYSSDFSLLQGQRLDPIVSTAKPVRGVPFLDPSYGTCIRRATDHTALGISGFVRNDYSRRQAFNADNSKFISYSDGGYWRVFDAATLTQVARLNGPAGDAEPQWHPTDPNLIRYLPTNGSGGKIYELDIRTNTAQVIADVAAKLPASMPKNYIWTKSEGSPSADHRYWCFMAEDSGFVTRNLVVFDLVSQTVVATTPVDADPDHVSMSPSGNWCIASFGSPKGVIAYSRDLTTSKKIAGNSEHSDIALLPNGHDAYVSVDFQSNEGDIYFYDIDSDVRTKLFANYVAGTSTSLHISGKAFNKKGWVLISTYDDNDPTKRQWLHKKIFAVELAANPRILNIAHHHTNTVGYWSEPQATVNRDFTKIVYTSNWEAASDSDLDVYMIDLPNGAVPALSP